MAKFLAGADKERRIGKLRRDIRKACRPQWAQLYKRQEAEQNELHLAEQAMLSRLRYWLRHRERRDKGFLAGAIKALFTLRPFRRHLDACHRAERKALAADIMQRTREAIGEENRHYRDEINHLARLQGQERTVLKADHGRESDALARGIAEDEARWDQEEQERLVREAEEEEDRPPGISEEFRKHASKRTRKPRKRDERGKGHRRE